MRRIIPHPLRRPHFIRLSLLLVLLLPFHAYVPWRYYSSQRRPGYRLQIARRGYDDYSNPTLEQLFGDKGVLYYQENSIIQENNDPARYHQKKAHNTHSQLRPQQEYKEYVVIFV